jgi:hypothetical protein
MLRDLLISHYTTSTMNMSPMLSSPHATVPFHWQKEVKKQLVRDVELGILEQVPA